MQSLTISLPEADYRRARVHAAAQDTSVSAIVRKLFAEATRQESNFKRGRRMEREVIASIK